MRLTIVGCAGSFPGPDSAASCYLVEAPFEGRTFRLVLDLGNGALGPLQRSVPAQEIDAVALSHLHADHCFDLCSLYVVRKYHPAGPMPRIPVFGPDDTADRMARAYDIDPDPGMKEQFDFRTFPSEPFGLGPFTVSVEQVAHPVLAFGMRVSHGDRTLVYSGDTGPCAALETLAKGADLFLSEASFMAGADNPPGLHMTGKDAATMAERAEAGRLVLTHIPAWHSREQVLAEAAPHFSGETLLAAAGAAYDV